MSELLFLFVNNQRKVLCFFYCSLSHFYKKKIYISLGCTKTSKKTHKNCLQTPTHPKYTSTYPHLPLPTHKRCPPTTTHQKYTSNPPNHSHPPIKNVHLPHPSKIYFHSPPRTHKNYPPIPTHPKYNSPTTTHP